MTMKLFGMWFSPRSLAWFVGGILVALAEIAAILAFGINENDPAAVAVAGCAPFAMLALLLTGWYFQGKDS
jgi:multisubunit Na+/H+ antiporter MnhB subunit